MEENEIIPNELDADTPAAPAKPPKPPCPFGKVLVRARKARDVTQYELAKRINRNTRHLAQIEQGRSEPRLSTILMLADALDMDACELVRETAKEIRKG